MAMDSIASRLATRWLGRAYEWRERCASTNDVAAERARAGAPAGLVVAAETQTAGRGRLGRTWHAPAGENLTFSCLLRPARAASEIPPLTLLVGAAVAEALAPLGVEPRLKWPNDVELVDATGVRRKLAGILTETATAGERVEHVIVGIGLNVNTTTFPDDLKHRATSLRLALGRTLERAELLADILAALEPRVEDFDRRGAAAAVEAFAAHARLPDRCRVSAPGQPNRVLEGIALGVDPDGALLLRDDDQRVHRVVSGELLT